ncbi:MAG: alanine racemase [Clostridia bacterium]|nr:alanine racemase [Clostridia bacterium]
MKYIINRSDIVYNIEAVKQEVGSAKIIGVVKGNGYGFGRDFMARLLLENGIDMFAVTEVEDAEALAADILKDKDILMLRSTAVPEEIARIADIGAIATIGSQDAALAFNAYCESKGIIGRAHLKIDTGMGRYGLMPGEIDDVCFILDTCKNTHFEGMYTHFAAAFTDINRTEEQLDLFLDVVGALKERGYSFDMVHAANSSAAFNVPPSRLDAVRIGSAFTGRILGAHAKKLKRVGYLEAQVIDMTTFPKGWKVGYNGTYTTTKPTKIAVVPVGHTDGWGMAPDTDIFRFGDALFASLRTMKEYLTHSHKQVEISGKKYTAIGQIGLSHTAVDVTGSAVKPGDTVKMDFSPLYVNPMLQREYVDK